MSRDQSPPESPRSGPVCSEPRALQFDDANNQARPTRQIKVTAFDSGPIDISASPPGGVTRGARNAPSPGPLFDRDVAQKPGSSDEPGKAIFGEQKHPLLSRSFDLARQTFPALYPKHGPRIERAIRQLIPPQYESIVMIAQVPLSICGEAVETHTRMTRDFADLNAAGLMTDLLDKATRRESLLERVTDRYLGKKAPEPDFKGVLTTLKASLQSFAPRMTALRGTIAHAHEGLGIALAALSAAADVDALPGGASEKGALHDRRGVVRQAFQQLELLSLQLDGFEAELFNLLSRVDQLMSVTLPAALAAKAQRG
ncbi:hypothetical protein [Caballeronia sp. ATUFL_M2_KS44]|uniref:hypothetical protein n=1 Tax=Caballeronia sp. ATUFL_M2_KS44 TaxID=2921767 RepID=UPI0020280D50|nr:hypothetical protein [Caballeronia sp. ATUFL_M2_KS44]